MEQAVISIPQTALPGFHLPAIIEDAGQHAGRRFIEFFTASIRNPNTRKAYAQATAQFMQWCSQAGLTLDAIQPVHAAAYIEAKQQECSTATVKQHLAAIRALFDYLVVGQVIPVNPISSVRGPKEVVREGKTPVMSAEQARQLIDAISLDTLTGLRDRAFIGVMLFTFARVSAVTSLQVQDYFPTGKRWSLRLKEKGGQSREIPLHHKGEEYLDAYLDAAGIRGEKKTPLFRSSGRGRSDQLTERPLLRRNAYDIIQRRTRQAGLPPELSFGNHSLRGTGITVYLEEGGQIETAQRIAGHADPRTTKLYDRRHQRVQLEEIEKIRI